MGNETDHDLALSAADAYLDRGPNRYLFLQCSHCGSYGDVVVPRGGVYDSELELCETCDEDLAEQLGGL